MIRMKELRSSRPLRVPWMQFMFTTPHMLLLLQEELQPRWFSQVPQISSVEKRSRSKTRCRPIPWSRVCLLNLLPVRTVPDGWRWHGMLQMFNFGNFDRLKLIHGLSSLVEKIPSVRIRHRLALVWDYLGSWGNIYLRLKMSWKLRMLGVLELWVRIRRSATRLR